ncbi:YokU family protein, partial [Priestia megaterium]
NTSALEKSVTYEQLMSLPRLLKRNYFDFSK